MKKLSLMAALTLSTMLSACGGGGGGHGYIPPSTLPDNPDQPVVSCTGVTCMTNEGLSNSAKRSELYNAATGGKTRMKMFARSGGNPIDEAYNNMHLALTGWAASGGSGSLDISDPDLRQNLVLAGFENLPEDDGELQEWAKARQYLIKRHAEKAYKMYGKQNNDVRLDNVKLHLVEETSNQDTFINFTLDNKKNINGIEISENDFTSEAVTNKLNYKGENKFSGSDKLHIYNLYCNDSMGKDGPRLYIEISGYDDEEPDLDFIKEKLKLKLQERAEEDKIGGGGYFADFQNQKTALEKIDALTEENLKDKIDHSLVDRTFEATYTSYAKDLKNGVNGGNLLYSDFGLLRTTETSSNTVTPIEKTQVFAGGYDAMKLDPTKFAKMEFKGDAVGGINYSKSVTGDKGIIETDTLTLENGKATLNFENGKENLNVTFNNWYDVDVTKDLNTGTGSISFSGGEKIADNKFKYKGTHIDLPGIADNGGYNKDGYNNYTNKDFIGQHEDLVTTSEGYDGFMDIGYYGKDGTPSEASGYVMYGEDHQTGQKVQDIFATDKDIQDFIDKNDVGDSLDNFKQKEIIEDLEMQIGVGMQKSK